MFGSTNDCPIYVPMGSVASYLEASGWSTYVGRIQVDVEAIDLGLPSGTKWASYNIGASVPEQSGDRFAWGEIYPRNSFAMGDYRFYLSYSEGYMRVTKYCTNGSFGNIDNNTVLEPEDDAAHVIYGGSWRIPTKEDIEELVSSCIWIEDEDSWGVAGFIATGPNGRSIYFPAYDRDEDGDYSNILSSTLVTSNNGYYYTMQCKNPHTYNEMVYVFDCPRYYGLPIRPVCD